MIALHQTGIVAPAKAGTHADVRDSIGILNVEAR
jgi:hypothetical protein